MNKYIKYPRTYHLPFSPGATSDDKTLENCDHFKNKIVVITEKMDGENTTMYADHIHARSIDSNNHPSRNWVKTFHSEIAHEIPVGWRICGENLYAKHSIHYKNLPSYFMGFSIWNDKNFCLSWDETLEWFSMLGIVPVPVLYRGIWDENLYKNNMDSSKEGFVVRVDGEFHYEDFNKSVAKYVRENHVSTSEHWMFQSIVPNETT